MPSIASLRRGKCLISLPTIEWFILVVAISWPRLTCKGPQFRMWHFILTYVNHWVLRGDREIRISMWIGQGPWEEKSIPVLRVFTGIVILLLFWPPLRRQARNDLFCPLLRALANWQFDHSRSLIRLLQSGNQLASQEGNKKAIVNLFDHLPTYLPVLSAPRMRPRSMEPRSLMTISSNHAATRPFGSGSSDEDPYSVAGSGSSGSSGGNGNRSRSRDKPPKLPPRDTAIYGPSLWAKPGEAMKNAKNMDKRAGKYFMNLVEDCSIKEQWAGTCLFKNARWRKSDPTTCLDSFLVMCFVLCDVFWGWKRKKNLPSFKRSNKCLEVEMQTF